MDTRRDDENISDANSKREAYNSRDTNSESPKTILSSARTLTATDMPEKVWTLTSHELF
jgi:hypothetical protein